MKYYLFIDNFRGFRDTCIPITDVNFFVGENSTGKTSVLGLLKLFSGPSFIMGQDFGDEHVSFSHFADMVSANSEDKSYFRIGFVFEYAEKRKGTEKKVVIGSLFTFVEKDGLPRPFKCTFCRGKEKITLKFGNGLSYKVSQCAEAQTAEDFISTLRSQWIDEHSATDRGYTRLQVPGRGRNIPIFLALSIISHADDRTAKQRKSGTLILHAPEMLFTPPELTWLAPIRTKPRRTYDELTLAFSPEGQHTPYLIRKMLQSKSKAAKFKKFIENIGSASGLFQDVRIRNFGRGGTARFELDIVLDDKALNVLNVGYGVSQSLPVIVELLSRDKGTSFAIQQPEVHLHPRAQAALGDLFFEMAAIDRKCFLIETHSDFAIDRFRMNYKGGRTDKPDSQILFFQRLDKHNVITPLSIGKTGDLPTDQPDSYRQFFIREQMNLLGI